MNFSSNWLDRFPIGTERTLGYFELIVEGAQLDVAGRNRCDQGKDNAAPRFNGGKQIRPGGLGEPPDAPPEIDLPARTCEQLERRLRVRDTGRQRGCVILTQSLACCAPAVADLWKQRCAGLHQHARGLFDVGGGDFHCPVIGQRLGDQRVEHRVVELLPPIGVGSVACVLFFISEGLRSIHRGAAIIGTDHAACQ